MAAQKQSELLGLDLQELTELSRGFGQPAFRGRQLFQAVYRERVSGIERVSTLPKQFREGLVCNNCIGIPAIESKYESIDGSIRYLLSFSDGQSAETVWMPEGDFGECGDGTEAGAEEEVQKFSRATICVSSQIGCAVNCQFCLTALLGVKRNLTAGEIVGQILTVLNDRNVDLDYDRINIVFMGMGEPFLNYDNFMKAVHLLVEGVGISEARMTVSTSGIVPRIYDFAQETVRPKLAISLNAPNDELRTAIMPINRKWAIDQLLTAAREFPLRNRERLTFEYVLLRGVNDCQAHAQQLVNLLRGIKCKVNLIALNPGPGIAFGTPEQAVVGAFQGVLVAGGIPTFVRRPRGRDIYAACGQLKRTVDIQAPV